MRGAEVGAHRGPQRHTGGQLHAAAAHQGRRSETAGAEAAQLALRDGDHRALPAARVVGGRGADRDVPGRRECAAGRRHHPGLVGDAGVGLDGQRSEPEDLRQDRGVASATAGGRVSVCLPRWSVAQEIVGRRGEERVRAGGDRSLAERLS